MLLRINRKKGLIIVMKLTRSTFLALCVAALLPFSAVAAQKPKVITTFTIIADMAARAGDAAATSRASPSRVLNPHYQPTPRDILKARDANLGLVETGSISNSGFRSFLPTSSGVPNVVVSDA